MSGFAEYAVVRTRRDLVDDQGRPVPKGSEGAIVHVYEPGRAYILEVVIADAQGVQCDAHVLDVEHDDLEPVP